MSDSSNNIVDSLWNENISAQDYNINDKYQNHILEQYKLCVEMADRVSARRNMANTFFLTLHTLILGAVAFAYEKGLKFGNKVVVVFLLVAVLALCFSWWRIVKSYRQLNTAKFKVIGEFEKRLPSSPFWGAEWKALGEGKDPKLYRPLTIVENWVPIIFGFLYVVGAAIILDVASFFSKVP